MSKSDLRARPVFHHDRDAIEAHLTVVMTALAVARYLQDTTGMSLKKLVQALRPLQQVTVNIGGHEHLASDPLTDTAAKSSTPSASSGDTLNRHESGGRPPPAPLARKKGSPRRSSSFQGCGR